MDGDGALFGYSATLCYFYCCGLIVKAYENHLRKNND